MDFSGSGVWALECWGCRRACNLGNHLSRSLLHSNPPEESVSLMDSHEYLTFSYMLSYTPHVPLGSDCSLITAASTMISQRVQSFWPGLPEIMYVACLSHDCRMIVKYTSVTVCTRINVWEKRIQKKNKIIIISSTPRWDTCRILIPSSYYCMWILLMFLALAPSLLSLCSKAYLYLQVRMSSNPPWEADVICNMN